MKKINHIPQDSKNAASSMLAAFFCVFRFLLSQKKASKKSFDFLVRGKTYAV
ncbi:hypothetical protein [Eubacterium sp.]|uniref:hypothetical protein n=1 Tax=Eubacterium sp. TaxID=142586 RepID=UPI0025BA428A|nr:hypothetical protein [Eubacterium sp.]MCI7801476.1 hypothetical protein [Eubacterium sp.]